MSQFAPQNCRRPHGLAIDASQHLWVTCEDDAAIVVLDSGTGELLHRFLLEGDGTHMLLAIDSGKRIVASHLRSKWLTIFDAEDFSNQRKIDIPHGAEGLAMSKSGRLWVTDPAQGYLTSLDLKTGKIHST